MAAKAAIIGDMETLHKWLLRIGLGAGAAFLLLLSLAPDGTWESGFAIWGALLVFSPFIVGLIIVLSFAVYNGIAHGDPFYEARTGSWLRPWDRPREIVDVRKRKKKWCPVCHANTTCRNEYNKFTKIRFHVQGKD